MFFPPTLIDVSVVCPSGRLPGLGERRDQCEE